MSVDRSPEAVSARLRRVAELADLRPAERLSAKIDYSAESVSRRLRQVSQLRRLCLDLAQRPGDPGPGR